jgi:C-terminal processing protease CtpA/Prc
LIDALSFSASECFAAAMQAIERAVIIGAPSPGGVTGANLAQLPNDGLLMYPVIQLITPAGMTPEGRGVIPDIAVELDRDMLLQGIDAQLETAVDTIARQSTAPHAACCRSMSSTISNLGTLEVQLLRRS